MIGFYTSQNRKSWRRFTRSTDGITIRRRYSLYQRNTSRRMEYRYNTQRKHRQRYCRFVYKRQQKNYCSESLSGRQLHIMTEFLRGQYRTQSYQIPTPQSDADQYQRNQSTDNTDIFSIRNTR